MTCRVKWGVHSDSGFAEPHLDMGTGGWRRWNEAAKPTAGRGRDERSQRAGGRAMRDPVGSSVTGNSS